MQFPSAHSDSRELRFGVMCDSPMLQEWQARCIRNLLALDNVQLSLVICNDTPRTAGRLGKWRKLRVNRALFLLYRKLLFNPRARIRVDMSETFEGVPSISCRVRTKGKYSQYFSDEDVAAIRQHNLDFILRFGFNIIRGEVLASARYGVWSFHHDDEEKYRGAPPCYWEIYFGDPVSGAILQRLTDRLDGGIILKKGYLNTIDYSYSANVDSVFLESANWPAQVCRELRAGSAGYLDGPPSRTTAPIYRTPNNLQTLRFARRVGVNFGRKAFNSLFRRADWNVGVIPQPAQAFLGPGPVRQITWLPLKRKGRFAADPFVIQRDGRLHILYEDYDFREMKGRIACVEVYSDGSVSRSEPAIELPVHMSYPYLFEHEGEVYCVPETFQAREITLFRAENFPREWRKVQTLVGGVAGVDPTIFQHEGRWWLLCTDADKRAYINLFIWYASDLLGPWTPHAANPVKIDIRSSRPAGAPFWLDGELYRPAQDCSRGYGGQVSLNKITRLTPTEFSEEPVATVGPDKNGPYPAGIHTFVAAGNMTVVDGKRMVFVRRAFQRTVARQLGRALGRKGRTQPGQPPAEPERE